MHFRVPDMRSVNPLGGAGMRRRHLRVALDTACKRVISSELLLVASDLPDRAGQGGMDTRATAYMATTCGKVTPPDGGPIQPFAVI
jgi:hypothetical protein